MSSQSAKPATDAAPDAASHDTGTVSPVSSEPGSTAQTVPPAAGTSAVPAAAAESAESAASAVSAVSALSALSTQQPAPATAETPAAGPAATPDRPPSPPTLRRRLATMLYEAVILFGIVFIAGYLFSTLTQQRSGLTHHDLLAAWIGLVVGGYFVWCWTHGGQTLPMKTWRLRVVTADGQPLGVLRAIARYVLAWLWFLPPLALHPLLGIGVPQTLVVALVWFALWAMSGRIGASRQFLHDRLARTQIVAVSPRR